MGMITPTTIITGWNASHRAHFAQCNDVVVICNGHDSNSVYEVRTGTGRVLGLTAPGVPSLSTPGGGVLNATYTYRVRWVNQYASTVSLGGTSAQVTPANQTVRITQPASPPSTATNWIIERTTSTGSQFYPVNTSTSAPWGTAIGTTTYDDNTTDAVLTQSVAYTQTQGVPLPYRFCFSNGRRIFMGGGRIHQVSALVTNSNTAVSSGSGFTSVMATQGQDLSVVGDTDGKTYKISAVGGATALTLATAYAGTTGTKTIAIAGYRDVGIWSEDNQPECYGTPTVGGPDNLSNWVQMGADGQPLTGGCGMGVSGVLWAKEQGLYAHYYTGDPNGVTGDGRIVQLPTNRGATGPLAIEFINGYAYGIDRLGIWRFQPGSTAPVDISGPIANDWRSNQLYFESGDNWHIGYHAVTRLILFWVTQNTDTYPKIAYAWSEDKQKWVTTIPDTRGVTRCLELPDSRGIPRCNFITAANGSAKSYGWAYDIGLSWGAQPSAAALNGTISSATSSTFTVTGAGFPTTDDGYAGVPYIIENATDGSQISGIIQSNTSSVVTATTSFSATVNTGDFYKIGPIECVYRSPRISVGQPSRKTYLKSVWIWPRFQTSSTEIKVQFYIDGNSTPTTYIATTDGLAFDQDGLSYADGGSVFTIDPTVNTNFFEVPISAWCNDVQIEVFSDDAGQPWSILKIETKADMDQSPQERKNG